jgi:hypothetical protein
MVASFYTEGGGIAEARMQIEEVKPQSTVGQWAATALLLQFDFLLFDFLANPSFSSYNTYSDRLLDFSED